MTPEVLDFVCKTHKLIVEVDGSQHSHVTGLRAYGMRMSIAIPMLPPIQSGHFCKRRTLRIEPAA
jgi:hypothetical protein